SLCVRSSRPCADEWQPWSPYFFPFSRDPSTLRNTNLRQQHALLTAFEHRIRRCRNREREPEDGSFPERTPNLNSPGVVLHNTLHDPESKTSSLLSLSGDKGFEHRTPQFFGDTASVISHGDGNPPMYSVGGANISCTNRELATFCHTVTRVHYQVRQKLTKLVRG